MRHKRFCLLKPEGSIKQSRFFTLMLVNLKAFGVVGLLEQFVTAFILGACVHAHNV